MESILEQFAAPWIYKPEEKYGAVYDANGMYIMFADVNPRDPGYTDKEERKAKLITIAPEMLAMLNKVRREMLKNGVRYEDADLFNEIGAIINKAIK